MLGSLIVIVVDGEFRIVMLFGTVFKTITVFSIVMIVDELSFVFNLSSSLGNGSLCSSSWSSISFFRIIMISFFALLHLGTILKTIAFLSIVMVIHKLFIL
jgi:hypothetical protein